MLRIICFFVLVMLLPVCGSASAEESNSAKAGAKSGTDKSVKGKAAKKKAKKTVTKKADSKRVKARKDHVPAVHVKPPEVKLPANVKELRSWSNPDYTRIAVTLDREATFEYHRIGQNPESNLAGRLYLDINGARLNPDVKDVPVADGLLKTARIAQYRQDTVRVVLDLESIKDYKIFTFSDPFRIMIDIRGDRRQEISTLKPVIEAAPPAPPVARDQAANKPHQKVPPPAVSKVRRIVIDPGHGGHDPGAVGPDGTKEKDVVLAIGLKLAKKLREEIGLDVVMTRTTDVFLELQERTAIANQVGADLFLSIHANAAPNRSASGIETYYLSLAKTEKAAQLAAKENGTSLEKVSMLQAVLFDLMANYKINDSAHLAEMVQKELHKKVDSRWPVKSLGVKQGPFYVLVGASMPSILVETAFLSNEKEEQRLKDAHYQDTTADGIAVGVSAYISGAK
ncbi:N-acetylmuramoyl-L-alanine amidase [Geobacter sp. OR-1]|uniref:N-acetylmuramoyl-L-alanine amidase n=1 Tax=Geobacter sp. OR-1 TaxID=1266765 RepID=UPI0005A7B36B|nr:N-acetylmuramoyl-L-alanine amidase [Geobacter sp. OR-1]